MPGLEERVADWIVGRHKEEVTNSNGELLINFYNKNLYKKFIANQEPPEILASDNYNIWFRHLLQNF